MLKAYCCSGILPKGYREGSLCQKQLFKYESACHIEIKCPRCHTLNWVQRER